MKLQRLCSRDPKRSGTLVTIPSVHVIRTQKENTRELEFAGVPGKKPQLRGLAARTVTNHQNIRSLRVCETPVNRSAGSTHPENAEGTLMSTQETARSLFQVLA